MRHIPRSIAKFFAADLACGEDRRRLFSAAEKYSFDTLINCAGADTQKPFEKYDEDKLTFQIRVNFEAAASMCAFAIAHRAEALKIVNISSVCGEQPMPYFAVYSAAKGALTDFSVALNREMRGTGVGVTAILAGSIYTRPDVVEYINSLGFWARRAAKSPEYVVKKSLAAAEKGKAKCVLGGLNKFAMTAFALLPAPLKLRVAASQRKNREKDAF